MKESNEKGFRRRLMEGALPLYSILLASYYALGMDFL